MPNNSESVNPATVLALLSTPVVERHKGESGRSQRCHLAVSRQREEEPWPSRPASAGVRISMCCGKSLRFCGF